MMPIPPPHVFLETPDGLVRWHAIFDRVTVARHPLNSNILLTVTFDDRTTVLDLTPTAAQHIARLLKEAAQ